MRPGGNGRSKGEFKDMPMECRDNQIALNINVSKESYGRNPHDIYDASA